MNTDARLTQLLPLLGPAVLDLVDHLPGTLFCVKDADGHYLAVNPTFVARTNKRSRTDVIGAKAGELFASDLAQRYEEQDAHVLRTGHPLFNELELIRAPGGPFRWHLTTKIPLRGSDGSITGIVSASHDVTTTTMNDAAMSSLGAVVTYIRAHLDAPLSSTQLAHVAGTSVDTLERRCKRVFGRSPKQLILSIRLDIARELLDETDLSIADIATACGYSDQAAFSRGFTRVVGVPPGRYRKNR